MSIIVFESHDTGFYHEAHAYDCKNVTIKLAQWGLTRDNDGTVHTTPNLEQARIDYEANNHVFEDAGEPGYNWDEHVKVHACVKRAQK